MAHIIQFPVKQQNVSNGYDNLARLIAVAATTDIINFYMESIEELKKNGALMDGEAEKLTEQGRAKRKRWRGQAYIPTRRRWEIRNRIVRWRRSFPIMASIIL